MRSRDLVLAVPVLPAVALIATPWLPFVNGVHLWLGIPSMILWTLLWVLAIVPALAAVEWIRTVPRERERELAAAEGQSAAGPAGPAGAAGEGSTA